MNKELYESIKQELVTLPEYLAAPQLVRTKLIQYLDGKNQIDYFTTLYAFYEYMKDKSDFSFMKTEEWTNFFKQAFNSCFDGVNIEEYLETFATMPEVLDTVLKECSDLVKEKIYNAFKNSGKLDDYQFKNAFDVIEKALGYKTEEENSLDELLKKYNQEASPINDETKMKLDEIFNDNNGKSLNAEENTITTDLNFNDFANTFNTEQKQDNTVLEENPVAQVKTIDSENGFDDFASSFSTEQNQENTASKDISSIEEQILPDTQDQDKPIIINDISLEETHDLEEEKALHFDQEIIPNIGINKEVTNTVEETYTPSVVASNNIIQTVSKDMFNKFKSRIIGISGTYELDYMFPKTLNGSLSNDKIATVDKETLSDMLEATLINKVLLNVVPKWQQNNILSKIGTKYTDAEEKAKTIA